MADFASALHARLSADPAVAAVVVVGGVKRIYPVVVPQNTPLPYIRYQTISDPRSEHLQGYDGARVVRVQVDCFASSYATARGLAEKIIAAVAQPATVAGVKFGRTKAEGPRDLGEEVATGTWVHRSSLDLLVEHALA